MECLQDKLDDFNPNSKSREIFTHKRQSTIKHYKASNLSKHSHATSKLVRYLTLSESELQSKVEALWERLRSCDLCGWTCHVNRFAGEKGQCQAGKTVEVSSIGAHYGEERPLVGRDGSGTIFLTHCSVSCVYCQNWQISQEGSGNTKSLDQVADMMIRLQKKGCHNINWVTPTHYAPQLVKALKIAKDRGLSIPIVYNTGGYDSLDTIQALDGIIDIYMPDMKYGSNEIAHKYSNVPNYWTINKRAVKEMHRQVGDLKINEKGIAEEGLLIRHLVLPNNIAQSKTVLDFIVEEISTASFVNIMAQYRPCYRANEFPELNQGISYEKVKNIKEYARGHGLHRGF